MGILFLRARWFTVRPVIATAPISLQIERDAPVPIDMLQMNGTVQYP
jgi:hypothetical protein